jgi:hypothetical protein
MLTFDPKARADMTEVILCLSAVYSGCPLPPRKKPSRSSSRSEAKEESKHNDSESKKEASTDDRAGTFRTDSQGYQEICTIQRKQPKAKKLASNSVAARRKRAATAALPINSQSSNPPTPAKAPLDDPLAFSALQGTDDAGASEVAFSSDFDIMTGELDPSIGSVLDSFP